MVIDAPGVPANSNTFVFHWGGGGRGKGRVAWLRTCACKTLARMSETLGSVDSVFLSLHICFNSSHLSLYQWV